VLVVSAGLFVRVLWMADLRNVAQLLAEVGRWRCWPWFPTAWR
jgi:hypothetical protein